MLKRVAVPLMFLSLGVFSAGISSIGCGSSNTTTDAGTGGAGGRGGAGGTAAGGHGGTAAGGHGGTAAGVAGGAGGTAAGGAGGTTAGGHGGTAAGGAGGTAAGGAGGTAAGGAGGTTAGGHGGTAAGGAGGTAAGGAGGTAAGGHGGTAAGGVGGTAAGGHGGTAVGGAGGTGTGGAGGGGGSSPDAGATCPSIANVATTITDTFMSSAIVPVGTGGVIPDGTYTLTAHIGYMNASTTSKMHTYTAKITGTQFDLTGHDNSDSDSSGSFIITTNASPGVVALVGSCPTSNVGQHLGGISSYTVVGTAIHFYSSSQFSDVVFTKQ
jgi:hypothetical protein